MARFAEVPYYLLDQYFEESHEGVLPEGWQETQSIFYNDVIFYDTDSTSTDWNWCDLNDWSWGRWYIVWPPGWSSNSTLIGDRHSMGGRGGYWTRLYVDIDDALTEVKFRSNVTQWVDNSYFIFTKDPSGATFDNGSDVYIRKDSYIHEYVSRLADTDEIYEWYFNPEKQFIYFGKIYLSDADTNEYRIHWYGMKDYALEALPQHNQTDNLKDYFDLYFDRIHHGVYGMLKSIIQLLDPKEVNVLDYMAYIADMYGITISEEISGAEWTLTEEQERDFIGRIIHWLKRKGTYNVIYILWKLLVENNRNKLNIYEMWQPSAAPPPPTWPLFIDRLYTAHYNVDAGNNLVTNPEMEIDAYWSDYNSPEVNLRSSDQSFDGSSSRIFRSSTGEDGIQSDYFTTELTKEYKCSAWVYPTNDTNIKIHLTKGSGSGEVHSNTYNNLTLRTWNYISSDGEQSNPGNYTRVVISAPSGGTFYVDHVRVHEYTGAGQYYYESKGVSAYPQSHGTSSGHWLTPHYKVEVDLSNQPLHTDAIINESTVFNLVKYWEIIRPVSRVPHYRLLVSPTADFTGIWNQLYSGEFTAVLNTTCVPVIAQAAAGTHLYRQEASSSTWNVSHDLASQNLIIQCFDFNNERIMPDNIKIVDSSTVTIELASPESGLVLMATADYTHDQSTASDAWSVTHSLGDDVLVMATDRYRNRIIPESIDHTDSNSLSASFSEATSGYLFAATKQYKHTQSTARLSWNIYHNFNVLGTIVQCFDDSGNRIYPDTLRLVSSNLAIASFDSAVTGYALVIGIGSPNTQDSIWSPCTSGYIKLGNGSETEAWNPWLNGDVKNEIWNIPNEAITYRETDNYYYITTENPLSTLEDNITEIGVFNVDDELVWYSYCDPIYKLQDVGFTLHYRISRL